jgi:hypothetical protein
MECWVLQAARNRKAFDKRDGYYKYFLEDTEVKLSTTTDETS